MNCPVCWQSIPPAQWQDHVKSHKRRKKTAKVWVVEAGPSHEGSEVVAVFKGPAAQETAEALTKELTGGFYGAWGTQAWGDRLKSILDKYGVQWQDNNLPCCEEVTCREVQIINARSAPNANATV